MKTTTTKSNYYLRALAVLVALAVAAGSLTETAKPAKATFPGANGKIAFESNRDGNSEIYVMKADGSNQTNLTNNAAADYSPAVSPNGKMIAFTSNRDGNFEIYSMNALDGSKQKNRTNNAANDALPDWGAATQ
jgi:TolB protein